MADQRAQQQHCVSTKAFSEQLAFVEVLRQHGDATLRPRVCVGAVVENCTEQTSDRKVGDTWSKNQSSEPEQDVNQVSTTLENLLRERLSNDSIPLAGLDEVSHEEWRESCTSAYFWKNFHDHANKQSESEMDPWNLDWRGPND